MRKRDSSKKNNIVKTSVVLDDETQDIVEAISLATGESSRSKIIREAVKVFEEFLLFIMDEEFSKRYNTIKEALMKGSEQGGLPEFSKEEIRKFLQERKKE